MSPVIDPVVQIRGLWSVFHAGGEDVVVHRDLDLDIARGSLVSIVGGSGSGKTVLLRQILGLATPARGTVTVLGEPASRLARAGAATRVGMLFQHGALFSAFSVLDNIALPLRELRAFPETLVREAALVKLCMVGLSERDAHKMPAELSGGMIKRVALARALIMDPPLLLLDEPTAGLDPGSSDAFCGLLASLHRELGLTVVMVTHDLDTILELSTQIAVVADKRIVVSGPPQEVLAFDHPFVHDFFFGGRGRRAMTLLRERGLSVAAPPATAASAPDLLAPR
ncbi:phospholipid/cholesterol/gamma-HCH transport system ATP-binding protein [Tibeticola sediminis]|uniref:Phospholipid/cholesterol/gamma-HCH transport system ATP-binding protein n=1 Tax=Tibeticola sediminis TaxID=1917811 RepID=A0A3N4UP61_9BURK|nr:ATP-binding cassette domain-containing protein [Tibeticola sediminis]RPE72402.1 phospholipid/cholesterol/gamma-HCH transport system ATP-binding protein [Tibeticola sediminis]